MTTKEQNQKDVREMVKLSAQTLVETSAQLEKTDDHLNEIGKSIVQLHDTADNMNTNFDTQTKTLTDIHEEQTAVNHKVDDFSETIKAIFTGVGTNDDKLTALSQVIEEVRHDDEQRQTELLVAISKAKNAYNDKLQDSFKQLEQTDKHIQDLNPHDLLQKIAEQMSDVQTLLRESQQKSQEEHKDVIGKIDTLDNTFKAAIDSLSTLVTKSESLNDAFETSISRLNRIDLKLAAINGDDDEQQEEEKVDNTEQTENEGE